MKRPQILLLAAVQAVVLVCLIMALTQHSLIWYLASAASVTLLTILAAALFLTGNRG